MRTHLRTKIARAMLSQSDRYYLNHGDDEHRRADVDEIAVEPLQRLRKTALDEDLVGHRFALLKQSSLLKENCK